jgi:DNA-binding transcriptional LysR family regulator
MSAIGRAVALGQIREAMERAGSHRETPAGTLRMNASAGAARQMEPIVFEDLRRYPDMTVDIVTEERMVDIVVDGFGAGVRLAELVPQDMISVPLGPDRCFAVVGSPAYFEHHPKPRTPPPVRRRRM